MELRKKIKRLMKTSTFRVVLIVIIMIIPINILTLMLSNTVVNEAINQVSQENLSALELYVSQIDDAMDRMSVKMNYMARNDINFGRLNSKKIDSETEYYNQLQAIVNLQIEYDNMLSENIWITGTYAFFPEKEFEVLKGSSNTYRAELVDYIHDQIEGADSHLIGKWELVQLNGSTVLVSVSNYKNAYYGLWIDIKELGLKLNISDKQDGTIFALTDEFGNVLCTNKDDFTKVDLNEKNLKYNGNNYILIKAASAYGGVNLIQIMPKNQVTKSSPILIRLLQIAAILTLCTLPIIIIAIQKWIISPVNNLSHAMRKIEEGNMEVRVLEGNSGSEFEQINRHFNHMMDEVSNLKINVYEEKLEKQQIRMRFLNQQIQPHFILNAMNILYSYEQSEFPQIQKMILCLSQYFRYIVNAKTDFVKLSDEMDHIRNYFEIQQTRYPDTFFSMVEYEEDLADCLIPPLLIQNFAENAIKHSIEIDNKIDIIVIAQKTEDNCVRIRLSDTGEGMSDELLELVRKFQKTKEKQEGLGVGIQNAIERLDILYNGESKFQITREKPHGTRVEIIFPIHRDDGMAEMITVEI